MIDAMGSKRKHCGGFKEPTMADKLDNTKITQSLERPLMLYNGIIIIDKSL